MKAKLTHSQVTKKKKNLSEFVGRTGLLEKKLKEVLQAAISEFRC